MKTLVLLVLVALCALSANGGKPDPAATMWPAGQFGPKTITTTTTSTTTPKPKPTTTTPKPTTTTTPKPKPTTTTTTKPKTTTTKTTTTTPKPKTTTPPVPVTPTPHSDLHPGSYNLTWNKKVCLLAQMALQIRLATAKDNGTFTVVPDKTKASGRCGNTTAELDLTFAEGSVSFMFSKNSSGKVSVTALNFTLSYPLAKEGSKAYSQSNASLQLFVVQAGRCYACSSDSVFMGNGLHLDITQLQLQAFDVSEGKFGSMDHCSRDANDYRIAIAVGVTLLVLVIIVVVVYVVGRKKRTDGYQSL